MAIQPQFEGSDFGQELTDAMGAATTAASSLHGVHATMTQFANILASARYDAYTSGLSARRAGNPEETVEESIAAAQAAMASYDQNVLLQIKELETLLMSLATSAKAMVGYFGSVFTADLSVEPTP